MCALLADKWQVILDYIDYLNLTPVDVSFGPSAALQKDGSPRRLQRAALAFAQGQAFAF